MAAPVGRNALFADVTLRGREFCGAYTQLIDEWLVDLYLAAGGDGTRTALVAVGGQGRREMAPQSDLDLLLLVGRGASAEDLAERLWYPIWDAGLKLGHAVRSVRDTLSLASDDLETATALLSARHLAGDEALTSELVEKAAANWRRRGRRWIAELRNTVQARHQAHGTVAFDLEPDLKEARGGLRDVHALRWALAAGAAVDPATIDSLGAHYDRLLEARVELHRCTGRPEDRLLLQEQDAVAAALDVEDADVLMAEVAAAGREIAWASDECWHDLGLSIDTTVRDRLRRERRLEDGLVVRDERVCLLDESAPVTDPLMVLRVGLTAARHGLRIGADTLVRLRGAPPIRTPWSEPARRLFSELLLTGAAAIDVVEALDRAELWEPLLREWRPNRSRPQRNVYHRFTVDRHLLECAAHASQLAHRTTRPDLLVLGALLHDIGKGYPGDHSVTGEHLASGIARRMGHTPGDAATIGFLARHHLLLADVATRRDLEDPATVRFVAEVVGTPERLALLHALSEADGLATGPAAWGPWKRDLVNQLAGLTATHLAGERNDAAPEDPTAPLTHGEPRIEADGDRIAVACVDRPGAFCRIAGVLALHGLDIVEAVVRSEDGTAVDTFRVRSSGTGLIRWPQVERDVTLALGGRLAIEARLAERERTHRRPHVPGLSQLEPGVHFDNEASERATVIEATGRDQPGLLYRLARVFSDMDLDVASAKIHTVGVDVVDSFYVTDTCGEKIVDPDLQAELTRALWFVLDPPA